VTAQRNKQKVKEQQGRGEKNETKGRKNKGKKTLGNVTFLKKCQAIVKVLCLIRIDFACLERLMCVGLYSKLNSFLYWKQDEVEVETEVLCAR
jgi:hypothetical protein